MDRASASWAVLSWFLAIACSQTGPQEPALSTVPCQGSSQYFHVDADGDGHGEIDYGEQIVHCINGYAPVGYSLSMDDCDDTDPTRFQFYCRDADGDGVGVSMDKLCAGSETPAGYVPCASGPDDCDDANPAISFPYVLDADGDGVSPLKAPIVCGPKDQQPPNTVVSASVPEDCDDTDPTVNTLYYQDRDGDGFGIPGGPTVCANPGLGPPPGFGPTDQYLPDCDDTRADVNPNGLELWSDGIDSNCNGLLAPYACGDKGSCDPAWFTVPIDPSCASTDLIITDVKTRVECYRVDWEIWIANQGASPISEYTLTIEGPHGTTVFQVRDALTPGARYPYPIPDRYYSLSGAVRFSVTGGEADCNLANNTVVRTVTAPNCLP